MSVLKKYNTGTSQWEPVVVGKQGNSGVIAVNAPITNSGTTTSAVLGFDANYLGQAAGKNAVINGGFDNWQRGAGPFTGAGGGYTADRFLVAQDAGSFSATKSTFTPGSAPVAGYEAANYLTVAFSNSAGAAQYLTHKIEGVRTFAGQTVTLSYWAKVSTPVANTPLYVQNFGAGGSSRVVTTLPSVSLTTSWAKYTQTFTIPSIAGKIIGTSDLLELQIVRIAASTTLDIWGVQLELGSVATPFTRSGGTLAGELAACQRYYQRLTNPASSDSYIGMGWTYTTTNSMVPVRTSVTMRVLPTSIDYSGAIKIQYFTNAVITLSGISINASQSTPDSISLAGTLTGGTANAGCMFLLGTGASIGFSAEL